MSRELTLTTAQKAAVMLVAMGKPSANRLLKLFKQEELKTLIEQARVLRTIPQSELERIVDEFEAEFAEGGGLLDSADEIDTIVNETLSPEELQALWGQKPALSGQEDSSVWAELEQIEPERVGHFLSGEHPQTAAMALSKLASDAAAKVLLTLEKPHRNEVLRRMMSLTAMPEAALRILENQLRTRVLAANSLKDNTEAQLRVASLLNEMDKEPMDELLKDLEDAGVSDLQSVRARLFVFEDVELLPQQARAALFDTLSTELITLALRGAPQSLVATVLGSIGQRSRRMIEAELAGGAAGISAADIGRARKTIATTAIRMAGQGLFELPSAQGAS